MSKERLKRDKRIYEIIEVGSGNDWISKSYDIINVFAILLNLAAIIMATFSEMQEKYGAWILMAENVTVVFFLIDYALRVWTAKLLYPTVPAKHAIWKYVLSFTGLVDLFSFLPHYLPFFFPAGTVAFRLIRIVRIFRLFRINAHHDSMSVIAQVLKSKRQQLFSSFFIILILMLAASISMYSIEHEVQPDVFKNAFSGIWWAASTLLTVGYGDIYPITTLGRVYGICITFLGVGLVAIPTGIISAGFVDQYTTIKKKSQFGFEEEMNFIKVGIKANDPWVGKRIADLDMPERVIISVLKRKKEVVIPRGDMILQVGDVLILGAEPFGEKENIILKEIVLRKENPWVGMKVGQLDISRRSLIVLVKRKNKALVPNDNMVLYEDDRIFIYTNLHLPKEKIVEV